MSEKKSSTEILPYIDVFFRRAYNEKTPPMPVRGLPMVKERRECFESTCAIVTVHILYESVCMDGLYAVMPDKL